MKQPTSGVIFWLWLLKSIALEPKELNYFYIACSLVAWPFQTQYISELWYLV